MFAVILAILTLRAVAGALYARVTERQRVAGRPAVGRAGLSWRALVVLGTTVGLAWVASVATFWPATIGERPVDSRNIVQVGSALAYRAIPLQASYCASKFARRGFVDSLRCAAAR